MKLLGIVHTYNEEDCVLNAVKCLVGHDVHVFDHGSTDNTKEVLKDSGATYHYVDRKVPFSAPGAPDLYDIICKFINESYPEYGWVTWIDADEVLVPPRTFSTVAEAIHADIKAGFGVIRADIHEYWITDADDNNADNYFDRVQFRGFKRSSIWGGINRGWLIPAMGDRIGRGRHRKEWRPWQLSRKKYILKHYPIRSLEHGTRKIMTERNWEQGGNGKHYRSYKRNQCTNLVKDHTTLSHDPFKPNF